MGSMNISPFLQASATAAVALARDDAAHALLADAAQLICGALEAGGKLLVAGNGGSAADAQHIAAEFVSRLLFDRAPLAALSLSESGPILTACGNDYGFETVFARQVAALGRPGDVLLCLSTSGNSRNLLLAGQAARAGGIATLGFTGASGGQMLHSFDRCFRAQAVNAQIVQQLHMAAAHAMLASIERTMFPDQAPP